MIVFVILMWLTSIVALSLFSFFCILSFVFCSFLFFLFFWDIVYVAISVPWCYTMHKMLLLLSTFFCVMLCTGKIVECNVYQVEQRQSCRVGGCIEWNAIVFKCNTTQSSSRFITMLHNLHHDTNCIFECLSQRESQFMPKNKIMYVWLDEVDLSKHFG